MKNTVHSEFYSDDIFYNHITKENNIFVTLDKEVFLDSLERANIIAEEKIKDINEAYRILSNPTTKRKYDRTWNYNIGSKQKKSKQSLVLVKNTKAKWPA